MTSEPPTSAKAILHTTKGPIEIELWAKECPLASRNFLQLCLDGYYDGCKFHRVVHNFIIQSGDPSGTGYGGSAIYDNGDFADEFHSRLRYNRRGLVGCANSGEKDSNGSQFIITLSETPGLNGKNTLFGRVVGDTIYNVITIGEAEVEEDDKPLYPATVKSAEIVIPYFTDLQTNQSRKAPNSYDISMKKEKRKPKVKLSYDNEEEDDDEDLGPKLKKSKKKLPNTIKIDAMKKPELKKTGDEAKKDGEAESQKETGAEVENNRPQEKSDNQKQVASPEKNENDAKVLENQINAMKNSIRNKTAAKASDEKQANKNLSVLEQMRLKYSKGTHPKGKKAKSSREQATLDRLKKFQTKLGSAREEATNENNDDYQDDHELKSDDELPSDYEEMADDSFDFLGHKFNPETKPRTRDDDLLITLDPRQEEALQHELYRKENPGKRRKDK